ncbi:hypothetical protein YC2023_099958 [Brassica napus]
MLQLYPGNLSAMKPSHYGAFKDLRKEINYLDYAILLYFYISQKHLSEFGGRLVAIYVSFAAGSQDTVMVFFMPLQFKPEKDIVDYSRKSPCGGGVKVVTYSLSNAIQSPNSTMNNNNNNNIEETANYNEEDYLNQN